MISARSIAAVDLGAESGRVQRFEFDGETLVAADRVRFPNCAAMSDGALRWDTSTLWSQISDGLRRIDQSTPAGLDSVGVDTWGLDSVLVGEDGQAVEEPVCYRDSRQLRGRMRAVELVGAQAIHQQTGAHLLAGNSLFGWADIAASARGFDGVAQLAMIADYLHAKLSGAQVCEASIASTSGGVDMRSGDWSRPLLAELGVPERILPQIVPAGTNLGVVTGVSGLQRAVRVVLPASHDTASAVIGTPHMDQRSVFISSGTWSLVGLNRPTATISAATFENCLTNETTVPGTVRLLQNVMGLWLVQECRREWAAQGRLLDYASLIDAARNVPPLTSVIDANDPSLLARGGMVERLQTLAVQSGSVVPVGVGAIVRCVIDSLAVCYALAVESLSAAAATRPNVVRVSGGGSRNDLLQQATAEATGLPVVAGPSEAAALGNAAMQLRGTTEIASDTEMAEIVARSSLTRVFEPHDRGDWDEAVAAIRQERVNRASHGYAAVGC